jgi:phosphate-selective porin OprO/OprP
MSPGRTETKTGEKLIGIGLLILIIVGVAWGGALANEEGSDELGQGLRWLPRLTFPPSDPSKKAGYLPLVGRDLSLEYLHYNFYLSLKHGLEVTKRDSDFYLRIGGRMYLDFTKYFEDKNDLGDDGINLRTFLLEADGKFSEKWHFRLSLGGLTSGGRFDTGGAFLDDAYASYAGTKTVWVFGQHQEPFSLEQSTSHLAITFMERALPNALVPGRSVGTSFLTAGDRWTLSAGLFAEGLADTKDIKNQGVGLTGRFTFRPLRPDDNFYHLGASFSFREVTWGDTVFYRTRPESGTTKVRYVNTGELSGVNSQVRMGIEMAFGQGPVSVQAEYIGAYLRRESGFDDLLFHGWYSQVSWFPTGESRRYIPREGIFGYPQINSKHGAVELAARYSVLHLTDGKVRGGKERNLTFGANWYISSKIRLMANYILVFADDNATDNGTVVGDDSPHILQFRLQFRF